MKFEISFRTLAFTFSIHIPKGLQLCNESAIAFYNCRPLNLGLKIFPISVLCFLFRLLRIRLPGWIVGREVTALRNSDLLLDVGGITFCDGREIFLLYKVLSILPGMLLKVPVVKMSQALGPFANPINRFWAKTMLPRCAQVFARGSVTSGHLQKLPLEDSKWQPAADAAFCFREEYSLTKENAERVESSIDEIMTKKKDFPVCVAIVPSALVATKNERYVSELVELVHGITNAGHQVVLLPNATRQGSQKSRNNDLVAIKSILADLTECPETLGQVTSVVYDCNTSGIRQIIQAADVAVTSRFHGMVAALSEAVPTIVIGWSH